MDRLNALRHELHAAPLRFSYRLRWRHGYSEPPFQGSLPEVRYHP